MTRTNRTIFKNVTVPGALGPESGVRDLCIEDGRIAAWGMDVPAEGATVFDARGFLALPGLVDAHVHLDKTLWGGAWPTNPLPVVPTLSELVDNERRMRSEGIHNPRVHAPLLLEQMIKMGTVALRSHIDIDPTTRLGGVEALLEVREAFRDKVTIEFVAFPQSGILVAPGVEELLDGALKMGVEVIGGLDPAAFDRDPEGQLEIVFRLAARYGVKVDIHLHERGTLGAFSIQRIAARVRTYGLQGRVTLSHAFALGDAEPDLFKKLLDLLVENQIAVVTSAPCAVEFAPHGPLLESGVTYGLGSDNIRDAWSPLGNGDMLDRVRLLSIRRKLRRDDRIEEVFRMGSEEGARLLGLPGYGLRPGCCADCVLVPARCVAEAVAACPSERVVLKKGGIVSGREHLKKA